MSVEDPSKEAVNKDKKEASQTLSQKRAAFALEKIKDVQDKPDAAEYARIIRKMPMMILQNGLGQAIAFCISKSEGKKESPHAGVVLTIGAWLKERGVYQVGEIGTLNAIMEAIVNGDRNQYMHAQQEALAILNWMKRFADAFLPKED